MDLGTILRDHERFKNLSAGFQSIALGVAALVAAVWAAYVFNAELRVQTAGIQVENAKAQLEKLRRELTPLGYFKSAVAASQIGPKELRYLSIIVSITNPGIKTLNVEISGSPVQVTRVRVANGRSVLGPTLFASVDRVTAGGRPANFEFLRVAPGDTEALPFVMQVPEPGLYLVGFSKQEESGNPDFLGNYWKWGAAQYVWVR